MKYLSLTTALAVLLALPLFAKGMKDTSNMTREQYINYVEEKVTGLDEKVSSFKTERDRLAPTSERYKALNKAASDIEDELSDIREELRDLRASTNANWSKYRTEIEKSFSEIRSAKNQVLAD